MSGLTWLHLSDWHHKDFPIDPEVVRDGLVRDIKERSSISPDLEKIDFIVFSGDAASGGRTEEYDDARKEFFDRILAAAGDVSPRRLFIVPGNHDLDKTEMEKLPAEFLKYAPTKKEVDQWLKDAAKREQLLRPFKDFRSFVASYTGQDSPDYSNVRTWDINGKVVSLLGINSAWLCWRHLDSEKKANDHGFTRVGERQIHGPLEEIRKSDLRIAVLHHSQEWLEYSDGQDVWGRLRNGCHFILHGHGHELEVTAEHGTKGDFVIIPAGAIFDRRIAKDPSRLNSYNFVHLQFESGKGTVFLRCWNNTGGEWTRYDLKSPEGKLHFDIPGNKRIKPFPLSAPHRISPPPRCFVGREKEIEAIMQDFEAGAVIVQGMGGMGKTALALVLAEKLSERYPDGQIMLEMKGTDAKPLSAFEAMSQIIRTYDPMFKPEKEDELKGRYFEILSSKKALLLLDNAASREQVEPLLPPKSCALLVTSRNRFALKDLTKVDLDVLPLEDAKKLLLEIAWRIGDHASELAKLCGCLPIALEKAAYAIREKTNISVGDHISRLEEARKRLDFVEASFSLSYELLTSELQSLWSLLSIFPSDFDLAGAAAVWEMEGIPAEDALGELVKWSLVDFKPSAKDEGGRYKLHDLARVFSDSRLEPGARETAQERHAKHYQELLWTANELFLQGGDSLSTGLIQFDADWMNIQIAQKWAKANRAKKNEIDEICSNFAWTWSILNLRLHPRKYIVWLDEALVSARKTKNQKAECAHLGNLGIAYSHLGEPKKAIEHYEQALKISREIGDRRGEGNSLGNLGIAYSHLGKPKKAIEHYEQALKISREIGDRSGEGADLCNLGNAYSDLGEPLKAIEYCEQALKISREIGDRRGEGNHLCNLGNAYSDLGEPLKAIEYCEQALKISREIGDRRGEGADLGNLGLAYYDLGEPLKAIECYEQALKISREIGNRRGEGADLGNLGLAYSHLGEPLKAIEYYEQALKISREIGDRRGEGNHLGNLGLAYSHLGEPLKAIEYYEQALKISREIGNRRGEGNHLGNLGLAYSHLGEPLKAIEYYEQALKISREIGDRRGEGNHLFNMSLSLSNLGQREKAEDLARSALEIYEQIESPHAETVRQTLAGWGS